MALTAKQRRFVDEYLINLNAAHAAMRAGYAKNGNNQRAAEIGYQLLQKPPVAALIAERQRDLQRRTEITQERVIAELARIGFADIRRAVKWSPTLGEQIVDDTVVQTNGVMVVDSDDLDDDTAAAISEIAQTRDGIKIKLHDKQAALVSIGRHLGIFDADNKLKISAEFTQADEDRLSYLLSK